ncbi:MAG TPA: flavodoxin family protein [Clostridiales bacterium]|nr:MAG: Iron-sulfur flavoprotein [Firmicutes bacterium ADurb.Bin262]HOU09815.1 flavodoxin family protein [Clostridiales bacterium]HQH63447.1 flavodoxin family protein [Clostridiales bacterium]HQK72182.1 flavodoxin family protein [Clostridiales bacterium]
MTRNLIINGSPRLNGNTRDAATAFCREAPDAKLIDAVKLKLSGCLGCDKCRANHNRCVIDDDTAGAVEDIFEAQNIVFASPVYCWGVTSQLKQIIDKLYSKDPVLRGTNKRVGLILVGGAGTHDRQYETIASQFEQMCEYFGWSFCFRRFYSAGDPGEMKPADLEQLAALGKEFFL